MKLSELVEIRSGFTFKDSVQDMEPGSVALIQAGDVNSAKMNDVTRIDFVGDKHLLMAGDILVSARGNVVARVVSADLLPAVAASSVFVLRPYNSETNPRYISRFLNSVTGQGSLKRISSGGYIKTLRKSDLEQLDIPVPHKSTQDMIVGLGDNIDAHSRSLQTKQQLLENIYEIAMKTIITEVSV